MKAYKTISATLFASTAIVGLVAWMPPETRTPATLPMHVLIVGGGPDLSHNQVAIESNVRYINRLLPKDSLTRILFADGNPKTEDVECVDDSNKTYFRAPDISHIDGPSDTEHVNAEMDTVSTTLQTAPNAKVLLYFTGHGSPDGASQFNDNRYDLWGSNELPVTNLAASLDTFPKKTPVALVMVQCFSGAFGNLLFEGGKPDGALINRDFCGFFASIAQRPAAGCTPEINEANYRDFTGYFFAALTGTDRLGKPVTGADYNHDGKVGMNEAFAYSLIHDESIDTPVCTSDVFLRHFVTTTDPVVFQTPYSKIKSWATVSQGAALEALTTALGLPEAEDRLQTAYQAFTVANPQSTDLPDVRRIRLVRLGKSIVLAHTLMTTGNNDVKKRYRALLTSESRNPLK